jgi:hypothetical protein
VTWQVGDYLVLRGDVHLRGLFWLGRVTRVSTRGPRGICVITWHGGLTDYAVERDHDQALTHSKQEKISADHAEALIAAAQLGASREHLCAMLERFLETEELPT